MAVIEFEGLELGPAMQACSERERKFVLNYLANAGNGADAARKAGFSDVAEGAKVRASVMLHRERVIAALEEVGRKSFRGLLVPAVKAAMSLIEKPDHPDHAKTALSVLSRLGLAERSGVDVSFKGELTVSHEDAALNDLKALLALGVPREQLVAAFGFSGLERYEKMLAAQPKVIEHRPPVEIDSAKNVTD
jgi:hypothetical protein